MASFSDEKNMKMKHFTHPGHPLDLTDMGSDSSEYSCNGCKILGAGKRYRCHPCNYDLHEFCATCGENLSSFMHPHPLTLVTRGALGTSSSEHFCDLCREHVGGLFYRCKACNFDVHPLCTQLPQTLRHVLHEAHHLKLQTFSKQGHCAVCRGLCSSWRYRCGVCGFDIHLQCVLIQCQRTASTSQRGVPTPARFVYQPPPAGYCPSPPLGGFAPHGFPPGMFYYPPIANFVPPHTNSSGGGPGGGNLFATSLSRIIYQLVGQFGAGVITDILFGT